MDPEAIITGKGAQISGSRAASEQQPAAGTPFFQPRSYGHGYTWSGGRFTMIVIARDTAFESRGGYL